MHTDNHHNPDLHSRPLEIELIRSAIRGTATNSQRRQLDKLVPEPQPDARDAFIIKRASTWLETCAGPPEIPRLFGDLWLDGEVCILFADTNTGKSVLAVQIGDSISRAEAIDGFTLNAPARTVLYVDFELTEQQFRARYHSGVHGAYRFHPNFLRAVVNHDGTGQSRFSSYSHFISNGLENALITTKARVLIIDNITCLGRGTGSEGSALALMQQLQSLKRQYHLSVLVLAHTPKRNPVKPISRNDLQGSKMLLNFADSAFAIGESQTQPGISYLKPIKQRGSAISQNPGQVHLGRIHKPFQMVRFDQLGTAHESAHLLPYTDQYRKTREDRILQLHNQGHSNRQIATQLGIAHSTVSRSLQRLQGLVVSS